MPCRLVVYVEGPSDKSAMEVLLSEKIKEAAEKGIGICFNNHWQGKTALLQKGPERAADILINDSNAHVVLLPDLYPKNAGGPNETVKELNDLLYGRVQEALRKRGITSSDPFLGRFHVHCFKYDLEVLLLAAREELQSFLGIKELPVTWREPVEDQDHENNPKKLVEELFRRHGKKYQEKSDAPQILKASCLDLIIRRCPQCFAPFVGFLESFSSPN
ncbi:MAG TPA: DUF4276 family protein [bacterium]|nr:DUF4276 family protein [bacterium]